MRLYSVFKAQSLRRVSVDVSNNTLGIITSIPLFLNNIFHSGDATSDRRLLRRSYFATFQNTYWIFAEEKNIAYLSDEI